MNKPQPLPVLAPVPMSPQKVACPQCHKVVFNSDVVHCRIVKMLPSGQATAKCKRCTTWVPLPLYLCKPITDQQKPLDTTTT